MARKKKEPEAPAGSPAWMATFCDMMTLVLVFFVLLYSMSSVDVEKWKSLVQNLRGNPSIFSFPNQVTSEGDSGVDQPPPISVDDMIAESDEWEVIVEGIKEKLADYLEQQDGDPSDPSDPADPNDPSDPNASEGPDDDPNEGQAPNLGIFITIDDSKDTEILIRCQGDILFDTLRADVKEESYPLIDWILADLIIPEVEADNISTVRIEGHTDERRIPAGREFKDNWELSTARARNVLMYAMGNFPEVTEEKYGLAGYSDTRPVNSDGKSDPEQYAMNRRVEFVMVRNLDKLPKSIIANPVEPVPGD